jgi:hypothetical protein
MTTSQTSSSEKRGAGGPPLLFAIIGIGGLVLMVLLLVLTVFGVGIKVADAPPTMGVTGPQSEVTHAQVVAALGAASIQSRDPQTPFKPGESPALINVPRRLVQAILPNDPDRGYIVIYELPGASDAQAAGRDFLRYLGSGLGQVQYPRDTQFVLRQLGPTLVFYSWSPEASADAAAAGAVATSLGTVGTAVTP